MAPTIEPGVAHSLARQRAGTISDLGYDIALTIPASPDAPIQGRLTATFDLATAEHPLVLDFAQPASHVGTITANDRPVTPEIRDQHLLLPPEALHPGPNRIAIDFVAGDGSLNRNDDYLYTLFVPDRARVALPLFDQPDLKAKVAWTLEVPADWHAVANGAELERTVTEHGVRYRFARTLPIPSYLLAFAAGRFEIETAQRNGRTLRLFHRETDRDKVERNLETIFDLHATALEWLERYTEIPYPFAKFDFVAVPAFQYGGMEHPGSIFYRDRSLFLDETATQNQSLGRASLIAHETAHMWFGNLVTMEWFDDVWMKEVFANFMAAKIVNPSFPEVDHELRFLLAHYPPAYGVDRTAGANEIRQPLDNLNEAGTLYGAIIYQKAPIVMRHLERLMGEEPFRNGLVQYLEKNAYANASWPDLVAELDPLTDEALVDWSRVWVNEPGRPTITVEREITDGELRRLTLRQHDPLGRGRLWNQRLEVQLGPSDDLRGGTRHLVSLSEERLEVDSAAGAPAPAFVFANGAGVGYGLFELDESSRTHLLEHLPRLPEAKQRAIAWLSLWDAMLEGQVSASDLIDLALRLIAADIDELELQRVLGDLGSIYWRYLSPAERLALAPRVEQTLWQGLESAELPRTKAAWLAAARQTALTPPGIERLRGLWSGELVVEGLPLSENDTTDLAQSLALREPADAESILDRQLARIDNPDRRARFEFERPALSADSETRSAFFATLLEPENRQHEPWVLTALGFLNHPLRADGALPFVSAALDELEEVQRTGDIFFPLGWLAATLGGHQSAAAATLVREFTEQRTDLPPRLRRKLLQASDPLFRAATFVHGWDGGWQDPALSSSLVTDQPGG